MNIEQGLHVASCSTSTHQGGQDESKESLFYLLPDELMLNIFEFIPVEERHKLSLVCHTFKRLSLDNSLFHYQEEMRICWLFLTTLLSGETSEVKGAVTLRRIQFEAAGNKMVALGKRALFLRGLIEKSKFEKLAMIDLYKIVDPNKTLRMNRYLERALLSRWKVIVKEHTDHKGVLLLPWYIKFNPHSFQLLLASIKADQRVKELHVNAQMKPDLTKLLGMATNDPHFPVTSLHIEPAERWSSPTFAALFDNLAQSLSVKKLTLRETQLFNREMQYMAQALRGESSLVELNLIRPGNFGNEGAHMLLTVLLNNQSIVKLRLEGMQNHQMRILFQQLKHTGIFSLDIKAERISTATATVLTSDLIENVKLKRLLIHVNEITQEAKLLIEEMFAKQQQLEEKKLNINF